MANEDDASTDEDGDGDDEQHGGEEMKRRQVARLRGARVDALPLPSSDTTATRSIPPPIFLRLDVAHEALNVGATVLRGRSAHR